MSELALLGGLVIGITLGLLGAGGSILTLPVLIFFLRRAEKEAMAESLAIVGFIALFGAIPYALRAQVHWKSVLFFGLPGMLGASAGAFYSHEISASAQLTLFALTIVPAAIAMLVGSSSFEGLHPSPQAIWVILLEAFLLGCLTGLIGVGGGFLLVPALVMFSHLPLSPAIGTSLAIIAMNALTGFSQQLFFLHTWQISIDWKIISTISAIGTAGSLIGSVIGKNMSPYALRKAFGLGLLAMGGYILLTRFCIYPFHFKS